MTNLERKLLSPAQLGDITLSNRIVMAPMTRSRAIGNVPNDLMATYYSQRATAGLIITEGVSPSVNGLGYSRIPGIYTDAQVAGWKKITHAVHEKNGRIFIQIMHTGRVAHPGNLPEGGKVVGPSAVAAPGDMWVDAAGMQPMPVPESVKTEQIPDLINEYVNAARNAMEAGFDGVEIHAANGYLPMQFLNPAANKREDQYGGSAENRNRFVLELTAAVAEAIGKNKVGIRLSPFNPFNGLSPATDEAEQYKLLVKGLKNIGVVYVHLLTFAMPPELTDELHAIFGSPFILNGGYTAERAETDLNNNRAELISFGGPFIANPDLVERFETGAGLAVPDQSLFYTPGAEGYTDYSSLNA